MFIDLFSATKAYWHKLDQLEAAYNNGQISLEEVNLEVKRLMAELGEERRLAFGQIGASMQQLLVRQKESFLGVGLVALSLYGWWVLNPTL
jgi:hypothetical protein